MPTTTTGSANIAILDSSITADLCGGIFYIDVSPSTFIGSGASDVLGASVKVTNPYGVVIKNYPTSGYDIYAPMTDDVEVSIPTKANNFQYGTYSISVQLTDEDGETYVITKSVEVKHPDLKNKTRKYGTLSATIDGVCKDGKVYIDVDTVPTYSGKISDSQVNDFTLEHPTSSDIDDLETDIGTFSQQLFEGVYKITGTICAHYALGDNVFANVNYKVKREKNIRCLLDESCIDAALSGLQSRVKSDCGSEQIIETQNTIIQALFLIKSIEVKAASGSDASDLIADLEEVLGCVCTCNCADGTPIINNNPAKDYSITGCNVEKTTVGLTDTYVIENYSYVVEVTENGGVITITAPVLVDCVMTQTITFSIGTLYTQVKSQITNSTEYDFWASIINNALLGLDPTCIGLTTTQMNAFSLKQKIQAILTNACIGGVCEAEVELVSVVNSGSNVIITWNNTDVYEAAIYLDDVFIASVLSATESYTLVGAADNVEHTWTVVAKCSNGSIGNTISGSFEYVGCPVIAAPTVTDSTITDADCPYDLTALVDALPMGITAEWHSLNNTNSSSLVADPTEVTGGTYFVFAKNADGCYSTGTQVIVTCTVATACSAPQALIVEAVSGAFRIRFQSATYPPPANSYTVKRRLSSDPDISGSYTTIGTPIWNASAPNRWEISDATAINNTLYVYRAISNCASSEPYIDYQFANITCPVLSLIPADDEMDYSFTGVGGSVDKYEVEIYDEDGITLIHTDTHLPAFPSPITGTFLYLDSDVDYRVRVVGYIGTYSKACPFVIGTTTGGQGWSISNTNNNSGISIVANIGNNFSSPTHLLYSGTYSSDPLTGTDSELPAVNLSAILYVAGQTILSATLNGVPASSIAGDTASWSGISGAPLVFSFLIA